MLVSQSGRSRVVGRGTGWVMAESQDAIAVLLPSYEGAGSILLDLASAVAPQAGASTPGRVLAFLHERSSDYSAEFFADRPGVEPRPKERSWQDIFTTIREENVGLLLMEWSYWTGGYGDPSFREVTAYRLHELTESLARRVPCDIAIVKQAGISDVRQILLPVRGGPQGLLTLRLATALAERHDASITLLHVEQPGLLPEDDAVVRAQLDALLARGAHATRAETAIVIADSVEAAIIVEAEAHQITIMGASPGDPGTPLLLGPVAEAVAAQAPGTLIIVKARE